MTGAKFDVHLEASAEACEAQLNDAVERGGIFSQLHVHDPDEFNFVEQNPVTTGGPDDLMQTARPVEEGSACSNFPGVVDGALFVLS